MLRVTYILILAFALVSFSANRAAAQVLFDEYHGLVSVPAFGSWGRDAREHLTDLRLRGYRAVVATGTYLDPSSGKKNKTSDTLYIVDEMRRLEGRTADSIVSRDSKGRPYLTAAECEEPPCFDTLRYDEQGRLVSVAGWGWDGSRFLSILYDVQGRVKGYDDDQHGGESVLFKYDAEGRVVQADYDVRPSDVSDTKRREKFEYNADGLLKKKTVQGNLFGRKVRGQEYLEVDTVDKLVFRSEATYTYLK